MSKKLSERNIKELLSSIIHHEGSISLQDFKERVSLAFKMNDEDLEESATRPNEAMYEQRIRNLVSHKNLPDDVEYEDETFKQK